MPQTCYRENQLNSYTITLHASSTTHSKITLMTDFDFPLPKKFRAEKGRQKKKEFTVDRMWQLLCFCDNTYLIFNQI